MSNDLFSFHRAFLTRGPRSRPLFFLGLGLLVTASALGGACGGDEDPGPGPIPIESVRAEYEGASCDFQVRCGLMPDKQTCQRLTRADDEVLQLIANVVYFGDVGYDPTAGRAWVEATRTRSCEDRLSVDLQLQAARRAAFIGRVGDGGPCLVDGECTGQSVCDRSMCGGEWCCRGACAPAPAKVPVGGSCSADAPCVDDAFCNESGTGGAGGGMPAGTCEARQDNGEDCDDPDACKEGQGCAQGKCFIRSSEGQNCNPNLYDACLPINGWCDPATSKCAKLPGPGAPCATDDRCLSFAYCDNGSCRMRPLEGEACPIDGSPPRCLGDLRCDPDVCVAPPNTLVCVPE